MATRFQVIGKAAWRDRGPDIGIDIEKARQAVERWLPKVGIPADAFEPRVAEIRKEMDRQKKPLAFVASFDGESLVVDSRIGTAVFQIDMTAYSGSDRADRRRFLQALRKVSSLVTDADLKAFDDGDPAKAAAVKLKARIATLEKEVATCTQQIKRIQDALKPKAQELLRLKESFKQLGG